MGRKQTGKFVLPMDMCTGVEENWLKKEKAEKKENSPKNIQLFFCLMITSRKGEEKRAGVEAGRNLREREKDRGEKQNGNAGARAGCEDGEWSLALTGWQEGKERRQTLRLFQHLRFFTPMQQRSKCCFRYNILPRDQSKEVLLCTYPAVISFTGTIRSLSIITQFKRGISRKLFRFAGHRCLL